MSNHATTVPYEHLRLKAPGFDNPRLEVDPAYVRELALAIGRRGLINRLIVALPGAAEWGPDDAYVVLAGQNRYHALGLILAWRTHLVDDVHLHEYAMFDSRAAELRDVPVEITADPDWESLALVDNLQRRDLSSYETARALARMADRDTSGAEIARRIGKSPSWVSRHLTCWRQAGPELAGAWRGGLAFERVLELAALDLAAQAKALEPQPARAVRGPANRPGIDRVKAKLAQLEAMAGRLEAMDGPAGAMDDLWLKGARSALRWVAEGKGDDVIFTNEEP